MRELEIATCVLVGLAVALTVLGLIGWRGRATARAEVSPLVIATLAGAAATIVVIALLGQWRWQVWPLAAAVIACAAAVALVRRASAPSRSPRPAGQRPTTSAGPRRTHGRSPRAAVIAVTAALVLGALGTSALAVMPVRFLPAPTGPHAIGTFTFTVTDASRPELFTDDPNDVRTLPAQVWYPAEPVPGARTEPYVRDAGAFRGLTDFAGLPEWSLSYLGVAETHAIPDAPPAAGGTFAVIVFFSGTMGYRQSNLVQVEQLASHGFAVIAIDQPGTASSVLLPDGRRIGFAGWPVVSPLVDQSSDPVEPAPTLDGVPFERGIAEYLARDGAAVLDHAAALNGAGPLAGRLDLEHVGAFGMSLGGLVVSQWCADDERVDACMIIDAPVALHALDHATRAATLVLTRPLADMLAEGWVTSEAERYDSMQRAWSASAGGPSWYVEVGGLFHADFTDAPFGSPLPALTGMTSARAGGHAHEVMRAVATDFFGRALEIGGPGASGAAASIENVLDDPPWPDVTVESRP